MARKSNRNWSAGLTAAAVCAIATTMVNPASAQESITATLVGGSLYVEGTSGNDSVQVAICGGQLCVYELNLSSSINCNSYWYSTVTTSVKRTIVTMSSDPLTEVYFDGGAGNDYFDLDVNYASFLYGGDGQDVLIGNEQSDWIDADDSTGYCNIVDGKGGNDYLAAGGSSSTCSGTSLIYGGDGDDNITASAPLTTRPSSDTFYTFSHACTMVVYAGAGDDWVNGGSGADDLYGEDGNDTLDGANGSDEIYGSDGNDLLSGGAGVDTIFGGGGEDSISGEGGNDELYGESGRDTLWGGDGDDYLSGGTANDKLYGNSGDDECKGGSGDDTIGSSCENNGWWD